MKPIFLLVFTAFIFSCNTKTKSNEISDSFEISLDTLIFESNDQFLYLEEGLKRSCLTPDKTFLFNYNWRDHAIEKIDLESLKLDSRINLEEEGPNGISKYITNFKVETSGVILIWGSRFHFELDTKWDKTTDFKLDVLIENKLGKSLFPVSIFSDKYNEDRLVGFYYDIKEFTPLLIDFDLKNQGLKIVDLPEIDDMKKYVVELYSNGLIGGTYGLEFYSMMQNNKVIINSNVLNEVVVYDLNSGELNVKKWDSQLIGSRRKYIPPKQADYFSDELVHLVRKSEEDITYGPMFWDGTNQNFFRFSYKGHFTEEKNENGFFIKNNVDVFLTRFDEQLNIVKESEIPELNSNLNLHFEKNGEIWIFENINDELAFVRMKWS